MTLNRSVLGRYAPPCIIIALSITFVPPLVHSLAISVAPARSMVVIGPLLGSVVISPAIPFANTVRIIIEEMG